MDLRVVVWKFLNLIDESQCQMFRTTEFLLKEKNYQRRDNN